MTHGRIVLFMGYLSAATDAVGDIFIRNVSFTHELLFL